MNACTPHLEALQGALETGEPLAPEALAHFQACPACRERLEAALGSREVPGRPGPLGAPEAVEAEVRARHRKRLRGRAMIVAAFLIFGIGTGLALLAARGVLADRNLVLTGILLALLPSIILAFWVVRMPRRLGLYKRLGPGRQLSGVCLGLAEFTHTKAAFWRWGFVLLVGFGVSPWIYVLLDLAMPVHPEDRPRLWRYRLGRWWRGRHAE